MKSDKTNFSQDGNLVKLADFFFSYYLLNVERIF